MVYIDMAIESLHREEAEAKGWCHRIKPKVYSAEPKWITDRKPTEDRKYMVTIDAFGHKQINLFYYGKPLMPNMAVKGKCWYRSDDEWGDVVYDDDEILAWMPLPKPYREDGEQE